MKRIPILVALICMLCSVCAFSQSGKNTKKGLVAYYPFNADADDRSGNRNHGVLVGGVTAVEDRFGNECSAMHFNGLNGYISVPSSRSLESPKGAITITSWFKLNSGFLYKGLKWVTVVCKSNLPTENKVSPQYRLQLTDVTLSMNTDFTENITHQLDDNKWYFYAMVYDGNRVTAYLDDYKIVDFRYDEPLHSDTYNLPLEIGRDIPGDPEYFYGALDDISIFNRALNESEIMSVYRDDSEKVKDYNPCQGAPSAKPQTTKPNREIRRTEKEESVPQKEVPQLQSDPNEEIAESPKPQINGPYPKSQNQAPPAVNSAPQAGNRIPQADNSAPLANNTAPPADDKPAAPIDPRKYEGTYPPMSNPGARPGEAIMFKGDTVDFQKTITVSSPDITIYPYDHQKEDGDIVSININGVWVVNKYRLKKKSASTGAVTMTLQPKAENYLISKAWNVGRIPPNTLTIEVRDGVNPPQIIPIESEKGRSGAIQIVYDPKK